MLTLSNHLHTPVKEAMDPEVYPQEATAELERFSWALRPGADQLPHVRRYLGLHVLIPARVLPMLPSVAAADVKTIRKWKLHGKSAECLCDGLKH